MRIYSACSFGCPLLVQGAIQTLRPTPLPPPLVLQTLNIANLVLGTAYLFLGDAAPAASFGLALAQMLALVARILSYGKSISVQLRYRSGVVIKLPRGGRAFLPYALADPFMILNLSSSLLCVALFALTWRADPFGWKPALMPARYSDSGHDTKLLEQWADLAAVASGLLWVQLVEGFKLTKTMSAMLFAIIAVFEDVVRFLFILLLWSTGVAFILYWLLVGSNLQDGQDLRHAMRVDIGDGHTDPTAILYFELMSYIKLTIMRVVLTSGWDVRIVFGLAVWSSVVVLLNLLVSNMVYNYLNLYRSFAELAVRARAELVVRAEETMKRSLRQLFYDRCLFENKVDFDAGDDGLAGGAQELLPIQELKHPAFEVLDRVERYKGPTAVDAPWELVHLHSGPTTDKFAAKEAHTEAPGEQQEGGPVDAKLLRRVVGEVRHMNQEIFVLKRSLKLVDDDAASVATSQSSFADGLANIEELEAFSAVDAMLGVGSHGRPAGTAGGDSEQRPSTAQRALTAAQQMATDMATLQARMAEMAAEMAELRALKAAAAAGGVASPPAPPPPQSLREVEESELQAHRDGGGSAPWLAMDGIVYDVEAWAAKHPGGRELLLNQAGRDVTTLFASAHAGKAAVGARAALAALPVVGRLKPMSSLRSRSSHNSGGTPGSAGGRNARRPGSGGSFPSGTNPQPSIGSTNSRRSTPSSAPMIDLND